MEGKHKLFGLAVVLVVITFGAGCASIVDGGPAVVHLNSQPTGAKVSVFDWDNKPVCTQTTPTTLSLQRSRGYFAGQRYKVVFEAPGYYPATRYIDSNINGWYFGNILVGGAIGMFAIDPLTGAMFTLSPKDLNMNLVPSTIPMTLEERKAAELKANPPNPPRAAAKSTTVQNNPLNR